MATTGVRHPVRSLAATDTGEVVQVRHILFGILRDLCSGLGIREGDILRCRTATANHLVLETPAGRRVTFQRDWARYVQVTAIDETAAD